MNNLKSIYFALFIALVMASCVKEEIKPSPKESKITTELITPILVDTDQATKEHQLVIETYRRTSKKNSRSACATAISVPRDYLTIQEAVDNACDNATISVSAGEYTEFVVVDAPGISFLADANVILNGGFSLSGNCDGITISNFDIRLTSTVTNGIIGSNITTGLISGNRISGSGNMGIRFFGSNEIMVHENVVSGLDWGIFFGGSAGAPSNKNDIFANTLSDIQFASVIGLQGDCDNNTIRKNIITNNPGNFNAGIMLYSLLPPNENDNNTVEANYVSNSITGIWIFNGGSGNRILNNQVENNRSYGFYINRAAVDNQIIENTFKDNKPCDIGNYADDLKANFFENNIAACREGI